VFGVLGLFLFSVSFRALGGYVLVCDLFVFELLVKCSCVCVVLVVSSSGSV